jgi:heptosyltransferase III
MTASLENPEGLRILIVTLRRLGDVLLMTPLAHTLRARWPAAIIHALVLRGTEVIVADNPDIDAVLAMPQRPSSAQFLQMIGGIWRRYDIALSTQTGDRPTIVTWAAGRHRVGFVGERGTGFWWKRYAFHHGVPMNPENHRVLELMRLAECLGAEGAAKVVCPKAAALPSAPPGAYAVIHATPMFRYRRWTDEGWRGVASGLIERGLTVVATGGPDAGERAYLDRVFGPLTQVQRLDGRFDWPEMTALLQRAMVYIGPDTSVTHLAAASGCPTVAIYGPVSPRLMGPWPAGGLAEPWAPAGKIQRRGNVWIVQHPLACLPCEKLGCEGHLESRSQCLDDLPIRQVLAAIDEALAFRDKSPSCCEGTDRDRGNQ